MRTQSLRIVATAFAALLIILSACDEGKLPNIAFKTGGDYVSSDATVGKNETVKFGIEASKAEKKDPLKKFNVSVSFDGAADTTIKQEDLDSSQGDNFEEDVTITTRDQAGTEKYTFTVTNRDGIINQVFVTLTVTE